MARALALREIQLRRPDPPEPPQVTGIRVMPPEVGEEVSSTPYPIDGVVVIKSVYWKQIHFCNISCGTACKVAWKYKRGVSLSKVRELSSKISAKLGGIGLPGISSEIASKLSDTVTIATEEETTRELIRTAKPDGGVAHAHWQLVERTTYTWEVKRFLRKPRPEIHVLEGDTDAFDETMLFYVRPDCPQEEEQESWLSRLLKGMQPVIAQGRRAGVILPAKAGADGSMTISDVPGSYRFGDRISRDALLNPFCLSGEQARLLGQELYLRPYGASIESFLREISGRAEPSEASSSGTRSLLLGLAVGIPLGIVVMHSAGEGSNLFQRASGVAGRAREGTRRIREAMGRIHTYEDAEREQGSAS